MTEEFAALEAALEKALGGCVQSLIESIGELILVVKAADYYDVMCTLHNGASLKFEQLIGLCGVGYVDYGDGAWNGPRSVAVSRLLLITYNWHVRVRVFAPDDNLPAVASMMAIWNSAGRYECEAPDLYGLVFEGHPDLCCILTDYGFIGHPFYKDLPVPGYAEMRYDPMRCHVVYQSVAIEPCEVMPHVTRED